MFMDTLQSVVKALNRAGFSDKDYRDITSPQVQTNDNRPESDDIFSFENRQSSQSSNDLAIDDLADLHEVNPRWNDMPLADSLDSNELPSSAAFVQAVTQEAIVQNRAYEAKAEEASNADIPAALEDKMNKHKMKDIFRAQTLSLKLPQFFIKVETGGWFDDENALQLFERDLLLKDFKLSQGDANINFEDVDTEMYRVDLEQIGDENYKATPFKVDANDRRKFNALILKGDRDSQIMNLIARLAYLIGNMYPITDHEIKKYVGRIIETFSESQIRDCLERDIAYVKKIKEKINSLANVHAYKEFNDRLDVDKILIQPIFTLPDIITPSANAPTLPKSLYGTEASMGKFESEIIDDFANLENIQW
jgi:type III restriction enzyme